MMKDFSFLLTSMGEATHAPVLDVGENGFGCAHPSTVKFASERYVELPSHALHLLRRFARTSSVSKFQQCYSLGEAPMELANGLN
jgi:hypothetical protein